MSRSNQKYHVELTVEARTELEAILRKSSSGIAKLRWAKILLLADRKHPNGCYTDEQIAEEVGLSERQIVRIRQKYVKSGVQETLVRTTRSDANVSRVLDGRAEAQLVAIACSTPPEGRDSWTLQMICDEMKRLKIVKSVCPETVRKSLKKTNSNLGRPSGFASRKVTAPVSSRGWKKFSTSTRKRTTKSTR